MTKQMVALGFACAIAARAQDAQQAMTAPRTNTAAFPVYSIRTVQFRGEGTREVADKLGVQLQQPIDEDGIRALQARVAAIDPEVTIQREYYPPRGIALKFERRGLQPEEASPAANTTPRITKRVDPVYPAPALAAHIAGDVTLRVAVDTEGKPFEILVIDGPPILRNAALDCVRLWTYEPARINNQPVQGVTMATVSFRMQ